MSVKKAERRVQWAPGDRSVKLKPVEFQHLRDHEFEEKPDGKRGCVKCGQAKSKLLHHGYPPSFNSFGSGANIFKWQGIKRAWMEWIEFQLEDVLRLPKGLGYVQAEMRCIFPDRRGRDQGNFRVVMEKALGDALTNGGWLEDDDWDRYEMGGCGKKYRKGVAGVELLLFPSWTSAADREKERAAAEGEAQMRIL